MNNMTKVYEFTKAKEAKVSKLETKEKHFPKLSYNEAQSQYANQIVKDSKKILAVSEDIHNGYNELADNYKDDVQRLVGVISNIYARKESVSRSYAIMDEFITRNEDLYCRYIEFLKNLKSDTEWTDHRKEIEYQLEEFGADEESEQFIAEEWLEQQSEGVIQ